MHFFDRSNIALANLRRLAKKSLYRAKKGRELAKDFIPALRCIFPLLILDILYKNFTQILFTCNKRENLQNLQKTA